MCNQIVLVLITISSLIFIGRRTFRYLSALQQDEYATDRFLVWYKNRHAFDTKGSLVALVFAALTILSDSPTLICWISFVGCLVFVFLSFSEFDPRREGKIKLSMTERARRIYQIYGLLLIIFIVALHSVWIYSSKPNLITFIFLNQVIIFQSLPFLLIASVKVLQPSEKAMQLKFIAEAKQIVRDSNAMVIGVTGSYGKTSVKNALGEVLQVSLGSTFWPRKGINTLMGNTREIRNGLSAAHKYAIIEMAAYREGSISKLCELAPPKVGIITAIGTMHLERFGGVEQIYTAKTELARAVPQEGIMVYNGDNPGARRAAQQFRKSTTLIYGFDQSIGQLDCWISDISMNEDGYSFRIHWQGKNYPGKTALLGRPSLSNIMAVFTAACALGANPKLVLAAISNLKPVDNRLSIERQGKVTRLKDAYNSNPVGFRAALDVLKEFPGKRRILMTPGMIELGEMQDEENTTIAEYAASICDLILFVGETNKKAFIKGLSRHNFDSSKIIQFEHRDHALKKLLELEEDGDVVLIENDLPDWYEDTTRF